MPECISKENENTHSKRYVNSNVRSSIIYNSQDFIYIYIYTYIYVYIYMYIYIYIYIYIME